MGLLCSNWSRRRGAENVLELICLVCIWRSWTPPWGSSSGRQSLTLLRAMSCAQEDSAAFKGQSPVLPGWRFSEHSQELGGYLVGIYWFQFKHIMYSLIQGAAVGGLWSNTSECVKGKKDMQWIWHIVLRGQPHLIVTPSKAVVILQDFRLTLELALSQVKLGISALSFWLAVLALATFRRWRLITSLPLINLSESFSAFWKF